MCTQIWVTICPPDTFCDFLSVSYLGCVPSALECSWVGLLALKASGMMISQGSGFCLAWGGPDGDFHHLSSSLHSQLRRQSHPFLIFCCCLFCLIEEHDPPPQLIPLKKFSLGLQHSTFSLWYMHRHSYLWIYFKWVILTIMENMLIPFLVFI